MAPRLTDKQKKRIKADYLELNSYNAVAKIHGISRQTVKNVVTADPETGRKLQQKKEENTAAILAHMETKKDDVCNIIDIYLKELQNIDRFSNVTPSQLTTALGTLVDKWTMASEKTKGSDGDGNGVTIVIDV